MTRWLHKAAPAMFALCVLGCDEAETGASPEGAAPSASAEAKAGGLADASNDPEVVALAKKTLGCEWKESGFKHDCAELEAWKKSELLTQGKADPTLVNMLADADTKVRWLAAQALSSHGAPYRKDKNMASAVVTAAEKETSETVGTSLGSAVARIDLKQTGLVDPVKKLISGHKLDNLRRSLAGSVLFNNREAGFYEFLQELAKNKSEKPGVRRAAVAAFWTGTPSGKHADSCKFWLEMAGDDEQDVAGEAAYMCAFYPHEGCTGQWDALLDAIEQKAKDGSVQSSQMASALSYLYDQKKASEAQKSRALAVAKTLTENSKNSGSARARALEFVAKKDAQGKTYAAKFENDQEFFVQSAAKRIKEGNK